MKVPIGIVRMMQDGVEGSQYKAMRIGAGVMFPTIRRHQRTQTERHPGQKNDQANTTTLKEGGVTADKTLAWIAVTGSERGNKA